MMNTELTNKHLLLNETQPAAHNDEGEYAEKDVYLFKNRSHELTVEKKSEGADALAILIAFLLSFSLGSLFGISQDDFNSKVYFYVHTYSLVIASSMGLCSVIVLTFLSIKLRRLLGRTTYWFGDGVDAETLDKAYPGEDWRKKSVLPDMFFASSWFYKGLAGKGNPRAKILPVKLYGVCIKAFLVMGVSLIIAIVAKVLDQMPGMHGNILSAILCVSLSVSYVAISISGADDDLV
eukprot:GILI01011291.1.p1 GENE.GILI01011291.1~~GILI01011291.1.p1  ORF type:complete len:253 (+),score=67.96 GILI01011291.1:54-761(+)